MIPVSLYIKNFLSYGEDVPPLDFTEFDVACLSGSNGHGKSAILDAMTWALWGEARKAAGEKSPSDGLLRLGTSEMQVEFEFDLEGDRFRVLRKFQRKGKKSKVSSLDFQVLDEGTNSYKSLTEKTSRNTQGKINATLRMNYDTFINSAFILQGRVDEFTKKTPRKRKEILAEILDLLRYDQLVELSKRSLKVAETEKAILDERIKVLKDELAHKAEYDSRLQQLEVKIETLDRQTASRREQQQELEKGLAELEGKQIQSSERQQQEKQLQKELTSLEQKRLRQEKQLSALQKILEREQEILHAYARYEEQQTQNTLFDSKQQQHLALQGRKHELENTIRQSCHQVEKERERVQTELKQAQKGLREFEQFLQRGKDIEEGFRKLQTAQTQNELLDETRNEVEQLEKSIGRAEKTIAVEESRLSAEAQSLKRQVTDLRRLAQQEALKEKELTAARQRVAHLSELEQEKEQSKERGTEYRAQVDALKEQQNRLKADKEEALEKIELLKRSESPQCPLCASSLDPQKKHELDRHFQDELQVFDQKALTLAQQLKEEEKHLKLLRQQYKNLEKQIADEQSSRQQLMQAENALQECRKASKQLEELENQWAALQQKIQNKDFAQEEHLRLKELRDTLSALAYDGKEHQALKKQLKKLRTFEGEHSKLEEARSRQRKMLAKIPEIERELQSISKRLAAKNYALDEQKNLKKLLQQLSELAYDESGHADIRKALQQSRNAPEQKAELEQAKKSIESLQQGLDELIAEDIRKNERLSDIRRQIQDFESELKGLPPLRKELAELRTQQQELTRERDHILQERGSFQNKYDRCRKFEIEFQEKEGDQKQRDKDCMIYGHLVRIFGKDGIQAHLIEAAFPEIEDKANDILARLTDNRTHITIESVKDLQSGKTKESLDIKISDELGTRSYEMYSGGESFRVDFAIRIALSKLLARRAGTRLKTLVIDEGFGTQDEQGLDQLVDAIKAISQDFEKILVITHLESLKNAFPVRIEVVKQPDIGSSYQIVH